MNMFRIRMSKHLRLSSGLANVTPAAVSWQFVTNNNVQGNFDDVNFGNFDALMQACIDTGAYCMIDLHNFARYNKEIIGGGGPQDAGFVNLWTNFAKYYAENDKVVFGLMNEPHDLNTLLKSWVKMCQEAVTAIRNAGATKQIILLPGDNFSSAASFVSTQSAELLSAIKNPDGTTDNLMLDLHQYLDLNNSGQHKECTTNNVEGFKTIAKWLRDNKRRAIVSETGASTDPSCMTKFCEQNKFIAENTDVFAGFVGWSAGGFHTDYILSLTPTQNSDGTWTDNELMKQCIVDVFGESSHPPTGAPSHVPKPSKTSGSPNPTDTNKNKNNSNEGAAVRASLTQAGFLLTAMAGLAALW